MSVKVLLGAVCLAGFVIALSVAGALPDNMIPTVLSRAGTVSADYRALPPVHRERGRAAGRTISTEASSVAGTYDLRVDLMGVGPLAVKTGSGAK